MSIKARIKRMVEREALPLKFALFIYNHLPFNNKFVFLGCEHKICCAQIKKSRIVSHGHGNIVEILPGCRLSNCSIEINGNNNHIVIGKMVGARGLNICIEDDSNEVSIGDHSTFEGNVHLACIEGSKLTVGRDCMFSANISVRTGDSHSILDLEGNRINPSKDVVIADSVWIGNTVLITKGVVIATDSIVGTGSVVTRKFTESNVVIAGNPASIVKRGINWNRARLPIKEIL